MIVGVVGGGVVGSATARAWLEHCREVRVYDRLKERRTHNLDVTLAANVVFVCLPTPAKRDGSCDTSVVDDFLEQYVMHEPSQVTRCLVLRSTLPIGYTRKWSARIPHLLHSPEFLTARCAHVDAQIPSRNVIGFPASVDSRQDHLLTQLYRKRWPAVPVHIVDSSVSEAAKLVQNSFFAVKVGFFNEVHDVLQQYDVGYDDVMRVVLADGRISPSHTKVPGPDGKFGFGGTCLPKDLASFAQHGSTPICDVVLAENQQRRGDE